MITLRIFWDHMGLVAYKGLTQLNSIVIIPPFFRHAAEPPEEGYIKPPC